MKNHANNYNDDVDNVGNIVDDGDDNHNDNDKDEDLDEDNGDDDDDDDHKKGGLAIILNA